MLCLVLLVVLLLIILFYRIFVRPIGYWRKKGVQEGNPIWVFGDFLGAIVKSQSSNDIIYPLYKKFSKERFFGVYQYNRPILVVKDTELIKQVTVKDFSHFVDHRTLVPEEVDELFGKNVFELKGRQWRHMRSTLTPAFTSRKLRSMFEVMDGHAERLVNFYLEKGETVMELDMKDMFGRYCNDVIMNTTFGVQVDSLREPNNEFFKIAKATSDFSGFWNVLKIMGVIMVPELYQVLNIRILNKNLAEFYKDLISSLMKTREAEGSVRQDLIQIFIAAAKSNKKKTKNAFDQNEPKMISMTDMASQAMTFIFGGVDSVSKLMSFIAYELAVNPEIQIKLRDEIKTTFQGCHGRLTYDILSNMKYLDAVVSEAARKWPGDFILDRACSKPYTIEPKYPGEQKLELEAGDIIWFPVYALHHDPQFFQNPEKFDPDRFLDNNKNNNNPFAYIPFGAGPRICIGLKFSIIECKTVFFHLLNSFELVPTPKSKIPLVLVGASLQYDVKDGFWFGLKRLNQ